MKFTKLSQLGNLRTGLRQLVRPSLRLLAGTCLSTLVVACWMGAGRQARHMLATDRYIANLTVIDIATPPGYTRDDLVGEVQQLAQLPARLNLIDSDLPQQLAFAFARHACIESIDCVEVQPEGSVCITAALRQPVLAFEHYPGTVDRNGLILPPRVRTEGLFVLTTSVARATGLPGDLWGDTRVHNAAKLADTLRAGPRWLRGSKFELTTEGWSIWPAPGLRIRWGSPPGVEWATETTTERKVQFLNAMLQPQGPFNVGSYREVDLRRVP